MIILLSLPAPGHARVSSNSSCYWLDQQGSVAQGEHAEELFEIASVSKVVTSYWAIRALGPYFRFNTRIYITPVGRDIFDVHIQGSHDPFWGRQLTHMLFSELNKNGVHEVRSLTFDENLNFRWSVVTDNTQIIEPMPQEIEVALGRHLKNLATEYPSTRQEAAALGLSLLRVLDLKVQSVVYLPSKDFKITPETVAYTLRSAPLYRYLKEMNSTSNNHVADHIFSNLGGVARFKSFIQQDMGMDSNHIQFINGSGNPVIGTGESGALIKEYNKASCVSILRILIKMHGELQGRSGLDLKDVMAVSGADHGTLRPRYDSISNVMVAKTGTVDPAVNLAGMISTTQGNVYFGMLMGTNSPVDWESARDKIRQKVFDLLSLFGGGKSINYTGRDFMPFDQHSGMTIETQLPDQNESNSSH